MAGVRRIKMRKIIFPMFALLGIASCSIDEPFYIFNQSNGDVIIDVNGVSYKIKQGSTKKIIGLHHEGGAVTYSDGVSKSYDGSLKALLKDWKSLRGKYICDGFWSAEFHVHIVAGEALELLPCSQENSPLVLESDNAQQVN